MGHSIAVMNTKGGVGKSTLVMALAETLSAVHGKNVLVIDSDSQTSMSSMLMHMASWEQMERQNRTLVDYLNIMTLGPGDAQWTDFVARNVSDVEEARSVYLIPSHMELSLFEREVSAQRRETELRGVVRKLLDEAMRMFDIVLIDCPPGLSLLTECWLREAQYFMPPTKPDYLAVRGLGILKKFRQEYSEQGFADLLGVVINLKDGRIASEEEWHARLLADPENRCFQTHIPRRAYIQRAADFDTDKRTFIAKYPGDAGQSIRALTKEALGRLASAPKQMPAPPVRGAQPARPGPPQQVPASAAVPVQAASRAPEPGVAEPPPRPAVVVPASAPARSSLASLEASPRGIAVNADPGPVPTVQPYLRVAVPLRPEPEAVPASGVRPRPEPPRASLTEIKAGK